MDCDVVISQEVSTQAPIGAEPLAHTVEVLHTDSQVALGFVNVHVYTALLCKKTYVHTYQQLQLRSIEIVSDNTVLHYLYIAYFLQDRSTLKAFRNIQKQVMECAF